MARSSLGDRLGGIGVPSWLSDWLSKDLEDVYREKYGGRYPKLSENVAAGVGTGLKAIGLPKHIAETTGRNITSLAEDWTPAGALTATEEYGPLGALAAVPVVGVKGRKLVKGIGSKLIKKSPVANVEGPVSSVVNTAAPKGLGGIRAYHGSPHSFKEFDISKIGTGEGAQAYGHGLYFAENESVAKSYREGLAGGRPGKHIVGGKETDPKTFTDAEALAYSAIRQGKIHDMTPDDVLNVVTISPKTPQSMVDEAREILKRDDYRYQEPGHMYEVDIAADPEAFLDWDKPLSEQPVPVQQSLAKLGVTPPAEVDDVGLRGIINRAIRMNGGDADPHSISILINNDQNLFKAAERHARMSGIDVDNDMNWASPGDYVTEKADAYLRGRSVTGEDIHRRMGERPDTASKMREAGIPGIKYLDQGSRAGGIGSRNYVVFDPKLISIVKKYGLAAAIASGVISEEMGRQMQAQGEI